MHNRLLPQVLRNQFDLLARRDTFALSLLFTLSRTFLSSPTNNIHVHTKGT